ncbi:hypothetical protein HYPSUDRAFT_57889 [Hypholoma sublateritium FD-334 SS-4]|uniref:Uncharacterized protein n=1 Tax=Hypholoma sublateritium (strain FD-334 SS-4) TaxID=945553 RepID=A0A0D2P9T4_HYPSF|nr:hypothetical protein HYPSUDRAFT_57889 [Hypholoma sublateritium FD-334 SS-4]
MPASRTNSPQPNARSSFVASYSPERATRHASALTDPPVEDMAAARSTHRPSAPADPTTTDDVQVRVHFCGPVIVHHLPRGAIPPALMREPQIHSMLAAHARRAETHGQDRALHETEVCRVDFVCSMRIGEARFRATLAGLMPPDAGVPDGGGRRWAVRGWEIVCAGCGERVRHLEEDEVWNARFFVHRLRCGARRAVGGGGGEVQRAVEAGGKEPIWGHYDWRVGPGGGGGA